MAARQALAAQEQPTTAAKSVNNRMLMTLEYDTHICTRQPLCAKHALEDDTFEWTPFELACSTAAAPGKDSKPALCKEAPCRLLVTRRRPLSVCVPAVTG